MSINKSNYEAFILDYLEGQLSADQKAALFSFLDAHPELAAEFDIDVDGLPLNEMAADPKEFPELNAPTDQMPALIDEKLAAALEGDIELPNISGNALAEKHWLAMQQTKIKEELVSNSSKNELKIDGAESQQAWLAAIAEGDVADGPLKTAALNDPKLANEIAWLKRSVVEPVHVSFGDLNALKQKETKVVPLFASYIRYGAVAAAVVGLLFWFGNMNDSSSSAFYQAYTPMLELTKSVVNTQVNSVDEGAQSELGIEHVAQFADYTPQPLVNQVHPTVQVNFARLIDAKGIANNVPSGELLQENESIKTTSAPVRKTKNQQVFASSKTEEFTTLKKLVVDKAKQKVSKDEEVQEETTLLKVVQERLEGELEERKKGRIQLVLPNKKKGQKLYFRMGKFEINKPSRVVELIHGS